MDHSYGTGTTKFYHSYISEGTICGQMDYMQCETQENHGTSTVVKVLGIVIFVWSRVNDSEISGGQGQYLLGRVSPYQEHRNAMNFSSQRNTCDRVRARIE